MSANKALNASTDTVGMSFLDTRMRMFTTVYLPLIVFLFVLLFPFYWMGITAFKPDNELLSRDGNPFWIVGAMTQNGLPSRDSSSASGFTDVIAIQ